jgi:hypothetical protein
MTDTIPVTAEDSTITPHPVAAFLTPEMRARVSAERFVLTPDGIATPDPDCRCPFAVALDWTADSSDSRNPWPDAEDVAQALGVTDSEVIADIRELLSDFDEGYIKPADVYALLGCAAPTPADNDDARGEGGL